MHFCFALWEFYTKRMHCLPLDLPLAGGAGCLREFSILFGCGTVNWRKYGVKRASCGFARRGPFFFPPENNPLDTDLDVDGLPDGWERIHGLSEFHQ